MRILHSCYLSLIFTIPLMADAPGRLPGFNVPAPDPGVLEIQTPILGEVKAGKEAILCTYLEGELADDLYIESYGAFQSSVGAHHAVLYTVKKHRAPGTYECGSIEESMQEETTFLAGTGGDSPTGPGTKVNLPAGVLFRAAKGQQIMIQTHWLNYTNQPLRGQAVFHIQSRKPEPSDKIADFFFVSTSKLYLNPEDKHREAQGRCTMREDLTFFMTAGHMHEYGKHVKVTLKRKEGETMTLIDHAWNPHFTAVPPAYLEQIQVRKGDELIVDCTYKDKIDKPLSYPTEMCGAIGFFYPARKTMVCFDDQMQ
ncbi:MAG TPA: hypothetical protein VFO10_02505 [Oligoflexus sp.]|uniref:monooxygenase n=1 Tax=Oligoflexus sp. TaxID=1971216 RepID=UPI002D802DA3|nr:hypothetical protein [Oligoflexus sp.]HET9236092.1 hypothetical protein [Oligoflexus sp.]